MTNSPPSPSNRLRFNCGCVALHDDLGADWTVARLASVAGLSRAAFAARFTAVVGEPVIGYLRAIRMQRARTLRRDQRATVASVARALG